MHFDLSLISKLPKHFICLQQLCRKFFDKFVLLTNREYIANEATFKTTDKVDDYIIIDTGASAGLGNAKEDYGAHQDIQNGPLVEFADGSSKQVTSTDILPIPSLPPETRICNKFDDSKHY